MKKKMWDTMKVDKTQGFFLYFFFGINKLNHEQVHIFYRWHQVHIENISSILNIAIKDLGGDGNVTLPMTPDHGAKPITLSPQYRYWQHKNSRR